MEKAICLNKQQLSVALRLGCILCRVQLKYNKQVESAVTERYGRRYITYPGLYFHYTYLQKFNQ